jgi:hypothetical protein
MVENRVFEISSLLAAEGMNVQNLVGEISEMLYFAQHPEEETE